MHFQIAYRSHRLRYYFKDHTLDIVENDSSEAVSRAPMVTLTPTWLSIEIDGESNVESWNELINNSIWIAGNKMAWGSVVRLYHKLFRGCWLTVRLSTWPSACPQGHEMDNYTFSFSTPSWPNKVRAFLTQFSDFFSAFAKHIAPSYHHDRCER